MNTNTLEQIQRQSLDLFDYVVGVRRQLHAAPELSYQEENTGNFVAGELQKMGIPFTRPAIEGAKHGVIGLIECAQPGATIALRADMDALPILEDSTAPYCSKNAGVMHACGHDAHTASLLGAAKILNQMKGQLSGKIKLVFQPGEEKLPGGASLLIQDGVLQNPAVQQITGQHVMPLLPAGIIGVRGGNYMASADEIYITVHGRGGHGAQPHTTIDPVAIAAQLITALQQVISRNCDPRMPAVLTIGKVIANGATNIIPDSVYMEGTFRTFDEGWRARAKELITKTATGIVEGMGAKLELRIDTGYPVLTNSETMAATLRPLIEAYVGKQNVVDLDLWMASEDFAYYTQQVPGFFYRLGTRNEARGIVHGLHTPRFDIDEDALKIAPGLMAWLAVNQLAVNLLIA